MGEINELTLDSVIVEGKKCRRDIPVSDDITVKRGEAGLSGIITAY
ncbi:MAG: hypothetical protein ACOC6R_00610 [Chloroflexota bacterium]